MPFGLDPSDLATILLHAERTLLSLHGARIFITGGTGFFGKWLLAAIAEANLRLGTDIEAVVLTRHPGHLSQFLSLDSRISAWRGDIRDFVFPPLGFSHILHAAAPNSFKDADEMQSIVVGGTRHLLQLAAGERARLLFISSGAVYGALNAATAPVAETNIGLTDPAYIHNAYASCKRTAEHLCALSADSGCDVLIARCFSFVGPFLPLHRHFAIGNFIGDALTGAAISINGDPNAVRSYLYSADLAVWLLTLLAIGPAGGVYNVGSDQAITIGALAERIRSLLAPQKPIRLAATSLAVSSGYVPDIAKARQEFGLDVWTDLDLAISRTAAYYRQKQSAAGA